MKLLIKTLFLLSILLLNLYGTSEIDLTQEEQDFFKKQLTNKTA